MSRLGAGALVDQYRAREVVYFLGAKDTQQGRSLDERCPAVLQGRHRLERGLNYKTHMDRFFAPHNHRLVKARGVAHKNREMFRSPEGRALLFD